MRVAALHAECCGCAQRVQSRDTFIFLASLFRKVSVLTMGKDARRMFTYYHYFQVFA